MLESIAAGSPLQPKSFITREDTGQSVATVFPTGLECLVFIGYTGELWLQPGKGACKLYTNTVTSVRDHRLAYIC
jgi:hypothetical protein